MNMYTYPIDREKHMICQDCCVCLDSLLSSSNDRGPGLGPMETAEVALDCTLCALYANGRKL